MKGIKTKMEYFYVTRPDAKGNTLITSYEKKTQAEKYGGGAKPVKGSHYLGADGKPSDTPTDLVLRSKLTGTAGGPMEGAFVLYVQKDGVYKPTEFRATSYGNANTLMKALGPIIGTLAVVHEQNTRTESTMLDEDDDTPAEAPVF